MLQSRLLKIAFICLIIVKFSEQSLGQGQGKRNLQPQQQQRQPPTGGGPQQRPGEERKVVLLEKAQEMRRYMNLGQQPCKDLYAYACGNWMHFQNLSNIKAGDRISVSDQLERQINLQLQDLLKGPRKATEYDDTAVKQFYRSCTQASASSPEQREYIKTFVEHYGGLPYVKDSRWQEKHYHWIHVIAQLKHRFNLDILISLTIPKTTQGRVIPILEEPQRTILPPHLCSSLAAQNNENKDEVFNTIQMEIKDNLKAWLDLDEADATRVAGDIQRFEYELCKYMRKWELLDLPHEDGAGDNFSRTSFKQVVHNKLHGIPQNVNNKALPLNILEAKYNIEFTRFIQGSLGRGHSMPREFYCRSEEYFQHLNTISRKGLAASFAYYIMYRALTEIMIPRHLPPAERPFYCVHKALQFFPDTLGNLYETKYRRDHVLTDLRDIFRNVKEAFIESLDLNADWLLDSHRKDIQMRVKTWKLKEPEYQAGAHTANLNLDSSPNYWKMLDTVMEYSAQQMVQQLSTYPTVIRQHLEELVTTIPTTVETRLHFSWALLQPPFYAPNYPHSLKYSTLGVIMANELVKHYDQQGWQDNPAPIVNALHFDSMDSAFERNKECFRIQVSNYFFNSPNVFRNGTQLREMADDTSAVNIAFAAYMRWLQEQVPNNPELQFETLPDMDFTNTQLFFIHYAQSRCAVRHLADAGTSEFFPLDRHTLERLSVNGPVSNTIEYGRDFNCLIGSEMNVDDKCLIF